MPLFVSCPPSFWLPATGLLAFLSGGLAGASAPDPLPDSGGAAIPIEVETLASILESRVLPDGTEVRQWLPATDIREGQVVYYTIKIRNPGQRAAHNVLVTKPVPANTRYVAGSAAAPGATLSFSIDGGLRFAPARELLYKDDRGALRPAPPETYTHIRWQMRYPLAPGATAYARFRAVFR